MEKVTGHATCRTQLNDLSLKLPSIAEMTNQYPGIISSLRRLHPELWKKFGVTKIGIFDCYLKPHQGTMSDLNVLVELEHPLGWKYFELKSFIEKKLGMHIDIFTPRALKPTLREEILHKTKFV